MFADGQRAAARADVWHSLSPHSAEVVDINRSACRRATGSAFKPFAGIARAKLRITKGENNLMIFGDENAHDARCKVCGSLLYSVVRDGAFVHVAMGTLVDGPTIRPSGHIFAGSKAPWFTISDDLPQYEEHVVVSEPDGG